MGAKKARPPGQKSLKGIDRGETTSASTIAMVTQRRTSSGTWLKMREPTSNGQKRTMAIGYKHRPLGGKWKGGKGSLNAPWEALAKMEP